jgi:hypothetical protein
MYFLLSTPNFTKVQLNTTKVKVHLRNGIAVILDQHLDLLGRVENDMVEIETNFENKLEKFLYILQDGVFIVSTKGLDKKSEIKGTHVYVYARRVREVNQGLTIEDSAKQYAERNAFFEKEIEILKAKIEQKSKEDLKSSKSQILLLNSKALLLKEEVEFLRRVVVILKNFNKK